MPTGSPIQIISTIIQPKFSKLGSSDEEGMKLGVIMCSVKHKKCLGSGARK